MKTKPSIIIVFALAAMTLCVATGCRPALTEDDRDAMWSAVSSNKFEEVKRLVEEDERRAHVMTDRKGEYTALHHAIVYNKHDVRIAEYLLQKGADPNTQTRTGFTPLHTAVWDSNLPAVEVLMKYGADVNLKEFKRQESPLEMSRRYGGKSHLTAAMERHLQSQDVAGR